MNKIVVVSMVKNEADVIESCMRHAAKFADEIFICDHMSTDRTLEILESLRGEGLPIKISKYEKNEINQDAVHDQLLSDAISSGADIIFPIDADEFPIYLGGNSNDLRKSLQNLDSNQIYWIKWIHCMLLEPEKDQDQFILNRPALRSKSVSKIASDAQPKIIIGVKAWTSNNLSFCEGHHAARLPNGTVFPQHVEINEIEMFHYFCRSQGQWLSKDLALYITHILRYSFYNFRGPRSQRNVKDFLDGKSFAANDLENLKIVTNPIPADNDLAWYKNEVTLKFSGGGASIPSGIFFSSHAQLRVRKLSRNFSSSKRSFEFSFSIPEIRKRRSNRFKVSSIKTILIKKSRSFC